MTFGNDIYTDSVRTESVINSHAFRLRKKKKVFYSNRFIPTRPPHSVTRISQTACTGCTTRTATRNILAGSHHTEVLSVKYTQHMD